jgi:hypothetical protein
MHGVIPARRTSGISIPRQHLLYRDRKTRCREWGDDPTSRRNEFLASSDVRDDDWSSARECLNDTQTKCLKRTWSNNDRGFGHDGGNEDSVVDSPNELYVKARRHRHEFARRWTIAHDRHRNRGAAITK